MRRSLHLAALFLAAALARPGLAATQQADADAVAAAIARAKRDGWNELRILAECRTEEGLSAVELRGSGVGLWNETTEIRLSREAMAALLGAFEQSGFAAMRPSYGGKGDPVPRQPPRVVCRVALELDGVAKQVVQLQDGRQWAPLRELALRILEAGRRAAARGVTAESLEDGLRKLAAGALRPEAFRLRVHRKPEPGAAEPADPGGLLVVEGARASLRRLGPDGYGEPRTVELTAEELGDLVRLLIERRVFDLPPNLYAPAYTDLRVVVLGHEKQIQARRFAGTTPATHGEAQRRFDGILEAILALEGRLAAEGARPR